MNKDQNAQKFYTETYDQWMSDWPGEIDFYRDLAAAEMPSSDGLVLDLACGTGRIALHLAGNGIPVVGLDLSPEMLKIARQKSINYKNISWVEGDMRSFELDTLFDLVLVPSHSFQNLITAEDQVNCIECVWRHLKPGGLLCMHLDHMNNENMRWLGEISGEKQGQFQEAEQFKHPKTGLIVQTSRAWSYQPASQTAVMQTSWKEIDQDGREIRLWNSGPIFLHCVFWFEMEHLFKRAKFNIEHVYGDFNRKVLNDDSPHMIWLVRK